MLGFGCGIVYKRADLVSTMSRRVVILGLLLAPLAAACHRAPEEGLRVVPQISPLRPRRVAFSPVDGNRLLVMEANGLVGVWDGATSDHPKLFSALPARAIDAAFSPDGRFVATASLDGRIRYWGADGHLEWISQGGHSGRARTVAATSSYVASGGEDGQIRLWNLDGSPLGEPLVAHRGAVVSLAVSSRGDLASLGSEDAVRLWKHAEGAEPGRPKFEPMLLYQSDTPSDTEHFLRLVRLDAHWGWDHSVAFSLSGDVLAAALFDTSLRLWNADGSARAVIAAATYAKRPVRALSFSPQGDVLASVGFDGMLRWWRLDGSPAGGAVTVQSSPVFSVAFSPRGNRVATAGKDDLLRIWNRDGSLSFIFPHDQPGSIDGVAFAPRAALLAAADDHGGVRLWNLDGTARGTPLGGQEERSGALAFSPAQDLFATAAKDGSVRLWDFSGAPRGGPMRAGLPLAALAFSPSGDALAVGTAPFQVWANGRQLWQQPIRAADYVQAIAFSPRGDFIVTGSWLGWIQVWKPDGSTRAVRPKQGIEFVSAVAVAPDGQTIAAAIGGADTVVQLFNLDLSPLGPPLGGYSGQVPTLTFSPSGQLVTGGADGVVRLWTLPDRRVESFEVGRAINQLGYWHDLLWVRTAADPPFLQDATNQGGTILFYNSRHTLMATMLLRPDAALVFTPDGWFSATDWPADGLRLYRTSGEAVGEAAVEQRRSPERVLSALTGGAR